MTQRIEIQEGMRIIPVLFGPQDTHRKLLERNLSVHLGWRNPYLSIEGTDFEVQLAASVIDQALEKIAKGGAFFISDLQRLIAIAKAEPNQAPISGRGDGASGRGFMLGRGRISPKSTNQSHFIEMMKTNDLVFCSGPAGTGKTFLAMAAAVKALQTRQVDRIVLTRPAVEAGERLGFLPGTLVEKVNPYLRPLFDALYELIGAEPTAKLLGSDELEIAPLAFMRGRTLGRAFVILDESQNTTVEQMRMFLTRIGRGSKVVVTGDPTQTDLPSNQRSGFHHAVGLLTGVEGIAMVKLDAVDVVRHRLVRDIIQAYEHDGNQG